MPAATPSARGRRRRASAASSPTRCSSRRRRTRRCAGPCRRETSPANGTARRCRAPAAGSPPATESAASRCGSSPPAAAACPTASTWRTRSRPSRCGIATHVTRACGPSACAVASGFITLWHAWPQNWTESMYSTPAVRRQRHDDDVGHRQGEDRDRGAAMVGVVQIDARPLQLGRLLAGGAAAALDPGAERNQDQPEDEDRRAGSERRRSRCTGCCACRTGRRGTPPGTRRR